MGVYGIQLEGRWRARWGMVLGNQNGARKRVWVDFEVV